MTPIEPKAVARVLVRRRTFAANNSTDVAALIDVLHEERYTGPVTVNMAQGGVRDANAEDKAELPAS